MAWTTAALVRAEAKGALDEHRPGTTIDNITAAEIAIAIQSATDYINSRLINRLDYNQTTPSEPIPDICGRLAAAFLLRQSYGIKSRSGFWDKLFADCNVEIDAIKTGEKSLANGAHVSCVAGWAVENSDTIFEINRRNKNTFP